MRAPSPAPATTASGISSASPAPAAPNVAVTVKHITSAPADRDEEGVAPADARRQRGPRPRGAARRAGERHREQAGGDELAAGQAPGDEGEHDSRP